MLIKRILHLRKTRFHGTLSCTPVAIVTKLCSALHRANQLIPFLSFNIGISESWNPIDERWTRNWRALSISILESALLFKPCTSSTKNCSNPWEMPGHLTLFHFPPEFRFAQDLDPSNMAHLVYLPSVLHLMSSCKARQHLSRLRVVYSSWSSCSTNALHKNLGIAISSPFMRRSTKPQPFTSLRYVTMRFPVASRTDNWSAILRIPLT